MTVPGRTNRLDLTPTQVALALMELARELGTATEDLEELEAETVRTKEAFDVAHAKAVLKAGMDPELTAAPDRKAKADIDTQDERLAMGLAKAMIKARMNRIDAIKVRVSVGQTVVRALQSELDLQAVRGR